MLLASIETIRESLGFDDMTDINEAIRMALEAAEPILASALGTEFARGAFEDVFYVSEPPYMNGAHRETQFRLSRGFLFGAITASSAQTMANLDDPGAATDVSSILKVNAEKGFLLDYSTWYQGAYVRIEYTAGFEADPADAQSYDPAQVPDWLIEAASLQSLILLASNPVVKKIEADIDTKMLGAKLGKILKSKFRYAPMAVIPM